MKVHLRLADCGAFCGSPSESLEKLRHMVICALGPQLPVTKAEVQWKFPTFLTRTKEVTSLSTRTFRGRALNLTVVVLRPEPQNLQSDLTEK